jgi:glucokinase
LDSTTGVIVSPPNLPLWHGFAITDYIREKSGLAAALENDANACAVAEWKFGAGQGTKNMVFFTFGTGLGAGLILDSKLYSGTNGNAGEVGHIRLSEDGPVGFGKAGSFEGFCSGGGIAKLGLQKLGEMAEGEQAPAYLEGDGTVSAVSLAKAAKEGDTAALEVYHASGKMLGRGLSLIIDVLNPERIVIGSIYARSGELFADAMEKELEKEALSISREVCRILPAALGEQIGDYAAIATAIGSGAANNTPLDELLCRYPALEVCRDSIEVAAKTIIQSYEADGKLLVCGNGGSAADADHIVGELMKSFKIKRKVTDERIPEELRSALEGALPAICLNSHSALSSAYHNDVDPAMTYAQLTYGYAKACDVFIGISTSGNAKNVTNAMRVAKAMGVKTIALSGKGGGKIGQIADVTICVPESETYKIQELHLPVYHYLCAEVERHFYGKA